MTSFVPAILYKGSSGPRDASSGVSSKDLSTFFCDVLQRTIFLLMKNNVLHIVLVNRDCMHIVGYSFHGQLGAMLRTFVIQVLRQALCILVTNTFYSQTTVHLLPQRNVRFLVLALDDVIFFVQSCLIHCFVVNLSCIELALAHLFVRFPLLVLDEFIFFAQLAVGRFVFNLRWIELALGLAVHLLPRNVDGTPGPLLRESTGFVLAFVTVFVQLAQTLHPLLVIFKNRTVTHRERSIHMSFLTLVRLQFAMLFDLNLGLKQIGHIVWRIRGLA